MNNYVIYIHTNKFNNKRYVGMTINTERRWRNDGIEYKPSSERNQRPFWNAIEKYGWENFEHEIVEEHLTFEEACEKEKYYIELYNTRDRNFGYNVAEGGNGGKIYKDHPKGMSGKKHSEEWRRKHSERMKGKNNPAYGRTCPCAGWQQSRPPRGRKSMRLTPPGPGKSRSRRWCRNRGV